MDAGGVLPGAIGACLPGVCRHGPCLPLQLFWLLVRCVALISALLSLVLRGVGCVWLINIYFLFGAITERDFLTTSDLLKELESTGSQVPGDAQTKKPLLLFFNAMTPALLSHADLCLIPIPVQQNKSAIHNTPCSCSWVFGLHKDASSISALLRIRVWPRNVAP